MMNNKNALDFFTKLVEKNSNSGVEKYGHDTTNFDAEFVSKYINSETQLLDLGAGTGLIINKIDRFVKYIDAVEPYIQLSEHINKSSNIAVHNTNIFDFEPNKTYDLITLFGFMHYFNAKETELIYGKCFKWAKKGAKIIIKNQFGVHEDVNVSGYSEELKSNYFAQYRYLKNEVEILKKIGFEDIDTFDIYPSECNRWENTHFYAIVAEKQ